MHSVTGLLVLGLLAERPWTAYELVKHLQPPSMAAVLWDSSDRTLYREPARLVAAGLAEVERAADDDGPPRYAITDAGRAALWGAVPWTTARFTYRNEALAALYACAGLPRDEIRARLVQLRDRVLDTIAGTAGLLHEQSMRGPSLPDRSVVVALLGRIHVEGLMMTCRWADEAIATLDHLDEPVDCAAFARAEWVEAADRLDRFVAEMRSRHPEST